MKKNYLTLAFLVLGIQFFFAQNDIYFGPKVGFNVTHIMYGGEDVQDLKDNSSMRVSTHFGGFVEIVLSDWWAVQPELLYTVKGFHFKDPDDSEYKSTVNFKYITLPVMVKYFVKERFAIELGPQVSYLLSAKDVEENGIFSSNLGSEASSTDLKELFNPIDLGVALGTEYITKSGFYLGARYEMGVLNIAKTEEGENFSMRNGAFMLTAGFSTKY